MKINNNYNIELFNWQKEIINKLTTLRSEDKISGADCHQNRLGSIMFVSNPSGEKPEVEESIWAGIW